MMPLYLVSAGIVSRLDEWVEDSHWCSRLFNKTRGMYNMMLSHGMEPNHIRRSSLAKYFFMCCLKHCTNALKFEQIMSQSKSSAMDSVPCVLHMHTRLIKKGITLIFAISLDEVISSNKAKRAERV
jgi:hypothetical protein